MDGLELGLVHCEDQLHWVDPEVVLAIGGCAHRLLLDVLLPPFKRNIEQIDHLVHPELIDVALIVLSVHHCVVVSVVRQSLVQFHRLHEQEFRQAD